MAGCLADLRIPAPTIRAGRRDFWTRFPASRRMVVREGMAWWYEKYAPADAELARLESVDRGRKLSHYRGPS
jgi:hypothetical protein